MKLTKRLLASAMCAATALCSATSVFPAVNAAEELADSLANDSGLDYDFARALQYSIYFYDANMCGTEVEENNLYSWRGNCHTYDAQVPLKPMADSKSPGTNLSQSFIDKYRDILDPDGDGCVDVAGGFHDAGDHVEFGMPENYAASTVGWGYYEFRDSYVKTGQQDHVETILRYFNDYLMKCTFLDDSGKVIAHCYQVGDGDIDHAYWNSPEVDSMVRPAFFLTADKPQTDYVASAAASLAINYLNFKDTDKEYAQKSLDYAVALFDFAIENPKELSDNEDGPKAYYRSSKWEDDYCWAAAWLYKITGDHKYLEEIYPNYDYYAAPCYVHCWNDVWGGAQCILGEISMDKPLKEGEHVYPGFIDEFKEAAGKSPYEEMDCWDSISKAVETYMSGGVGSITPAGYWWLDTWGSARYNTAAQLVALVYDKYNNNGKPGKYSEWAKSQMEYIMGDNPLNRSYIVGYNENSVKYPHHRACSGLTKCEDPDEHRYVLYGALAGGPDAADKHNDTTADWIYNEVTIDYNAAFVGACAGLYEFFGTDEMQPTKDFPPAPKYSGGNGGGNNYWVNACGIDDLNADGCGVTKVSLMVMTDSTKINDDISVRYYFNSSEISDVNTVTASKLYDQAEMEAGAKSTISGPYKYDKTPDTYYIEIKWDGYNIANSGKKYQFTVGMYYGDKWNPANDWSYDGLKIFTDDGAFFGTGNEVKTDNICVYSNGIHIGGTEPDGSTPVKEEDPTNPSEGDDDILYGDANCDGTVDMSDAVLIMQSLSNPDKYGIDGTDKSALTLAGAKNGDCYMPGDGLTNNDALAIQKFKLDLIPSLPETI
ncbi:MAG: glycoside hydrolase family 9 protein [Ruminococcus flavefaciens]|nr:glycoside hydrolase family 9 protein [Ruminococcus flavefaciens]MCM1059202.1 glycoside hydrolase family 9 protein [Eubacterium sp.]